MENENKSDVNLNSGSDDTIKIKVPSFAKNMKANPWMIAAIVLGVLAVFFFFKAGGLTGATITGRTVSEDVASQNLVAYLEQGAQGDFNVKSIENEYGMYKVNVDFQGQVIPIYVTKDGKYAGSFQPITDDAVIDDGTPDTKVKVSEDDDPVKGNANAPVTIIEFSDYECPFCGKFYEETYPQIVKDYVDTGKVKIVFRDFPLSFHQTAMPAALAAQSVFEKGGDEAYFKYHNKLFENQQSLTDENLKKWAKEMGYDISKDFDSKKFEAEINKDLADGQTAGVSGTPAFFINGRLIEGAQPYANFKKIIDEELAKA